MFLRRTQMIHMEFRSRRRSVGQWTMKAVLAAILWFWLMFQQIRQIALRFS